MRCNECDRPAAYAPKHGPISVGLCEEHIKEYIAALDQSVPIEESVIEDVDDTTA